MRWSSGSDWIICRCICVRTLCLNAIEFFATNGDMGYTRCHVFVQ
jgi:hypothetical protein